VRPQLSAHLGAGLLGKHEVEEDHVGARALVLLEGGVAVGGDRHLESLLAEHVGQGVGERLLVFDYENAGHGSTFPSDKASSDLSISAEPGAVASAGRERAGNIKVNI